MPELQTLPPVVELRQYTLHPGRREELIALFEREFVEPQEACGMRLLGLFRDLGADNRFVWLRGFAGMAQRAAALGAFYGGPVWRAHRDAANATMVDSDDVLLLRPSVALLTMAAPSPRRGVPPPDGRVAATICPLRAPADDALRRQVSDRVLTALAAAGATPLAVFESESAPNTFPRLPVREGEHVIAWFASTPEGHGGVAAGALLDRWLRDVPQTLQLQSTARSAWR
jgi:hypothetical protein